MYARRNELRASALRAAGVLLLAIGFLVGWLHLTGPRYQTLDS